MQQPIARSVQSVFAEPKSLFRADTDQNGDWYVWRRLSASGWATLRRCDSREVAVELAASMNDDAASGSR